jgi:hypothetical protein
MAKDKHKDKHKRSKHRNAAGAGAASRPRRRYLPRRGAPPDFWTTVAAVAGGAGSAVLSGLVVNQNILSPEATAIGMIGIGGTTAYFAEGNTRVVGNSMASAGAGQLALALMGRRALAKGTQPAQAQPQPAPAAPPQLPAPQASPRPANADRGGAYVVDVFRDAANQLDMLDEEAWRVGTRDAAPDYDEIDDEAA